MKAEYILCQPHELKPGQWTAKSPGGPHARCPNGLIASLKHHDRRVDLGSGAPLLTVSPSILCTNGEGGLRFHGYIENGIWLDENKQPCTSPSALPDPS